MKHKILRAHSKNGSNALSELESKIDAALSEGWQLNGTPFEDKSALEWCQSVTMNPMTHIKTGEVPLREPEGPPKDGVLIREPGKSAVTVTTALQHAIKGDTIIVNGKPLSKQEHERLKKR